MQPTLDHLLESSNLYASGVVRCASKSEIMPKRWVLKMVGSCAQIMLTILGFIVNTIGRTYVITK